MLLKVPIILRSAGHDTNFDIKSEKVILHNNGGFNTVLLAVLLFVIE